MCLITQKSVHSLQGAREAGRYGSRVLTSTHKTLDVDLPKGTGLKFFYQKNQYAPQITSCGVTRAALEEIDPSTGARLPARVWNPHTAAALWGARAGN